jgi:TM2 domain-containing membrane protein YozV
MLEPMRDRTRDLETGLALADRHPRFVATVLAAAGCVIIAGATSVVSVLALPALLLSAPWALSLSLIAAAVFVAHRAGKRRGTGGVDPDVEQQILDVAVAMGGRVTTTAVAHALCLPLVAADGALTELTRAGYLGVETHPASGVVVYVFPEVEAGLVPVRAWWPTGAVPSAPPALSALAVQAAPAPLPCGLVRVGNKTRQTAALLAICGGALGAHRFYLNQPLRGLLYLVAFWTLVPAIIGLLDGLRYLAMSDQAFDLKHNVRLTS